VKDNPGETTSDGCSVEDQALRLFAEGGPSPKNNLLPVPRLALVPDRTEPLAEPPPLAAASRACIPRVACELEIIATLDEGAAPGERIADAFRRKEHELGTLLASLSVDESRRLHQRLVNPTHDDPIAVRMKRLTPERCRRLIAFLADARRRAAFAKGR
jgi:hypothetical protein